MKLLNFIKSRIRRNSSLFQPMEGYKVLQIRHLTPSTFVLRIERKNIQFLPGQCLSIGLNDVGVFREYSIYSSIHDPFLEILIKAIPNGIISSRLQQCTSNELIKIGGPYGKYTLSEPSISEKKFCFISTGTGIAPFHSFVKSYPSINYQLIHGIRTIEDSYESSEYKPQNYISCTSNDLNGQFHGRVTDYLKKHPIDTDCICYLCGNHSMIEEVYDILMQNQISPNNIFTEVFF